VFGISFAKTLFQQERKEVKQMQNAQALLAGLIFLANITASGTALAADGVLSKDEFKPSGYCHEKFPAIEGKSLASNKPVLKSPSSGDVIDFYGPCDENPAGKDQQHEQKLEFEHHMNNDYE
jgi:hypothetical protein